MYRILIYIIYTFLNWLFCVKTNLYVVNEDVVELLIPAVALWIPLLIWLRPRIKLLDVKSIGRRDPLMVYLLIAWVAIGLPLIAAQRYMNKASGQLTQLDNINQIEDLPLTKYYKVRHYFVDSRLAQMHTFLSTSGRGNANYNIDIYAPLPVFDKDHTLDTVPRFFFKSKNRLRLIINGVYYPVSAFANVNPKDAERIDTLRNFIIITPQGDSSKNDIITVQMRKGYDLNLLKNKPNGMRFIYHQHGYL